MANRESCEAIEDTADTAVAHAFNSQLLGVRRPHLRVPRLCQPCGRFAGRSAARPGHPAQDNGSPSNFRTQNITVNITNLNEAPAFLAPTTFTIAENCSVGYQVGDVNAVDPDAGQTLTYSIVGGDPSAQFAINANTGVITVAKATINYEATQQFVLQVKARVPAVTATSRRRDTFASGGATGQQVVQSSSATTTIRRQKTSESLTFQLSEPLVSFRLSEPLLAIRGATGVDLEDE